MTRTIPLSPFFEYTRRGGKISWMSSGVTDIISSDMIHSSHHHHSIAGH